MAIKFPKLQLPTFTYDKETGVLKGHSPTLEKAAKKIETAIAGTQSAVDQVVSDAAKREELLKAARDGADKLKGAFNNAGFVDIAKQFAQQAKGVFDTAPAETDKV